MEYIELLYIVSTILLLIGLRKLSSPATARKGNLIAASGMILAIVVSIFSPLEGNNGNYLYIFGGVSVGVLMGLFYSNKVKMTEIQVIEREWAMRYNSELPKWQQEMYQ